MGKRRRSTIPTSFQRLLPFVKVLLLTKKNKSQILRLFPVFVTDDILEILYNITVGKLRINKKTKKLLNKHQTNLIRIVDSASLKSRRVHLYKQRGGFLASVLPLIASLVGGIVSGLT